tara:strand:- start:66632 stop:66862 length:231 start_codon:yes stop_codon:yes gene_type:complete
MKYKVKDEYRKSPLSLAPGGHSLIIEENGHKKHYDKIKNVSAYIAAIKKVNNKGIRIWSTDEDGNQLDLLWYTNLK